MAKLLTSAQMQEADRRTIVELGIPGMVLMENAGAGVAQSLFRHVPDLSAKRLIILAGRGNNGGDGFVVGRRLLAAGVANTVFLFGRGEQLQGDAKANWAIYTRLGGEVRSIEALEDLPEAWLEQTDLVVDAVFGTGLTKPVTGLIAEIFTRINQSGKPVVAVDIPSGVSADTGQIMGISLQAAWTVTFGAEKIGHRLYPGASRCGPVELVDIGIPACFLELPQHGVARNRMEDLSVPPRLRDGHKGTFGHLLIVAGSLGKAGAAVLTALGAQKTGPGLVTVATPHSAQGQVAAHLREAMTLPLPETEQGEIAMGAVSTILVRGLSFSAVAIGPGLGTSSAAMTALRELLLRVDRPTVVDADGITLLAQQPDLLKEAVAGRQTPMVLTPHPGEMARLLNCSTGAVQANRLEVTRTNAQKWGVWLVLKGAGTVIAAPDGRVWINETGNSGLAAGGSGDLLTGIIAGLLTQQWSMEVAVRAAVWLHGAAADVVAADGGEAGILASDLLPHLRILRNRLG